MPVVVRPAARAAPALRCAVCHAEPEGAEVCRACGALTHPECRLMAGGCPTLGCGPPRPRVVVTLPVAPAPAAIRFNPFRCALLTALLGAGVWRWAPARDDPGRESYLLLLLAIWMLVGALAAHRTGRGPLVWAIMITTVALKVLWGLLLGPPV